MFAWLADLSEELRFERMRRRAMRDLARMGDAALSDVGIERDLIGTIAQGMVARREAEDRKARARRVARLPVGARPVHCG